MSALPTLVLALLLLVSPTHACLTFLADLAPGSPDAEAVVLKTYGELLDVVGKGRLSPALLKRMSEGDPFAVPTSETEIESLGKRLSELKALVEKKGWLNPPLLVRLQRELARRSTATDGAKHDIDQAVKIATTDFAFDLSEEPAALGVSPDGRWVVKPPATQTSGGAWEMDLYDTQERKIKKLHFSEGGYDRPRFARDGREIFFVKLGKAFAFPFANGAIDPKRGTELGGITADPKHSAGLKLFGKNPNWFLVHLSADNMALVDRSTGKTSPIRVREVIPHGDHVVGMELVPGSDQIMLYRADAKYEAGSIKVYNVSADGGLLYSREITSWKSREENAGGVEWLADGRDVRIVRHLDKHDLEVYVAGSTTPLKLLPPSNMVGDFSYSATKIKPHPHHAELVVMRVSRGLPPYLSHFSVYDLETGKTVGSFAGPAGWTEDFTFTGDGNTLILSMLRGKFHGLSYESRLNR